MTQRPSEPAPVEPPARPRPAVPARDRRHLARTTIDVHGRRPQVELAAPVPALQALATWLTPAFYVDFGRPCNSACAYCAVPPHLDAQGFAPFEQVEAMIDAGVAVGCERAILIGGEPTLYPQLPAVLRALTDRGLHGHVVMTNGLRLAEPGFVEQLREGGVATVHFSLDTVDAATYDRLSRTPGKHGRQLEGMRRALASGLQVYLYTALTRWNAAGVPDLLRWLAQAAGTAGRPPPPVVLAVVKPLGDALAHPDLLLAPTDAVAAVRAALAAAEPLGVEVGFRNLQACLAPDLVARSVDYYLDDFSVEVATRRRLPFAHTEYWLKPPDCARCGHEPLCWGIYRDAERLWGTDAFRPVGRDGLKGHGVRY